MSALLDSLGEKISTFFGDPIKGAKRDPLFVPESLANLLPWESFDPESSLFFSSNSVGFVIEALPLVGVDAAFQKELTSLFEEVMEEGSSFQCLLFADPRVGHFLGAWKGSRENATDLLKESAFRRSQSLSESGSVRLFRFMLSYSFPLEKVRKKGSLKELIHVRERTLKTLRQQTGAFLWDAQDLIRCVDGMINFSGKTEDSLRSWREEELLSSQIPAGGSIEVEEDGLSWSGENDFCFRSFRVIDYPSRWSLSSMNQLIGSLYRDSYRMDCPFVIQYGVHCPDQDGADRAFKSRMYLVENQGKSGALMRMIPDLVEELQELDFVRRSVHQSCRFVWTQLAVGLWSSRGLISQDEQKLRSLFRMHQFSLAECRCLHLPQFLSFLPMSWAEYVEDLRTLNVLKTTISSECGNLVPLIGEWMGTSSPGMLLVGRRGQLMNWNPFDNAHGNYNVVVVGRSGSGKSVFMQDLIMSSLGVGTRVYVIEVGRSFEKTCSFIGGQQIEFTKDSGLCLNPFTHISDSDPQERDQSLAMLKSIVSCMAAPSDGTSDYENALIERAIRSAWDMKGKEATITTISQCLQKEKDKRAVALGVMLTPYSKGGIYARYFEGENTVNFHNDLVLVELEELKEKKDLQSVVMQMFIMTITNQTFFGDRKTPFHICIDEAWDLLRGEQTGVFIETLARRLRKYNGSLVIGTQSVDDFYSTPGALAAYENSDWMCLLSQKKSSIQRFFDSGKVEMDEEKKRALESVTTLHGEFSEVMICDGEGGYSIGRLKLDPFSQLLYSTKAEEFAKIKRLQERGYSVSEAIEAVLVDA